MNNNNFRNVMIQVFKIEKLAMGRTFKVTSSTLLVKDTIDMLIAMGLFGHAAYGQEVHISDKQIEVIPSPLGQDYVDQTFYTYMVRFECDSSD